jgi:hypothetical protein
VNSWKEAVPDELEFLNLGNDFRCKVIPAQAGIHYAHWIPACAGMTSGKPYSFI